MRIVRFLVLIGLLMVLALQCRMCLRPAMVGKPAGELFSAGWFNSEPLSMKQLQGKLVLLDFWSVW